MSESEEDRDRRKSRRDDDDDDDEIRDRKRSRQHRRDDKERDRRRSRKERRRKESSSDDDDESEESRRRRRRKKSSRRSRKSSKSSRRHKRKKRRKRSYSSSEDSSSSAPSSSDDSSSDESSRGEKKKVVNERLLAKLNQRGETLEERKERRAQKRAAKIQSRFGYTAEENPFNDPNLHEAFTWTKKKQQEPKDGQRKENTDTLEEIDNIRRRRKERDAERDEMDRLRAEEARMKELENYDDWAKKEELFHLEQQRKRSAIRLVEGREKPIDVLAKNMLLFGLTEEEKKERAAVKYQERYNALDQVEKLEAELDEPHKIVKVLKLVELNELLLDIDAFRILEKEGQHGESKSSILQYWDALYLIAQDEIKFLQNGGEKSSYSRKVDGIREIFDGQSVAALMKMKAEIETKLASPTCDDRSYWLAVREQLLVHLAKLDLSEIHKKMLVRQLEKLEQRKSELEKAGNTEAKEQEETVSIMIPKNVEPDFGNKEEELGVNDEVNIDNTRKSNYSWQDRYAPRKPRYFNRVKTGWDWNKYNQTHYDSENPPPKIVQGYSFNIFYPDLVDPTTTPRYFLEPADSDDFCIIRFQGGAPYEDIAFKIINREWNRSRKRGFRCTFERGILSLYFNFTTHWYRR